MPRKARGAAARASYDAYRALLSRREKAAWPPTPRRRVSVIVATCTGSECLSERIGLPLAFIDVAKDVDGALHALRSARHGCCEAAAGPGSDFAFGKGWDDWRLVHVSADMTGTADLVADAIISRGVLSLGHSGSTPFAALRRSIGAALAPLRLHEVASAGHAVARRSRCGAPALISPRYTPLDFPVLRRCVRADDVYALDPWAGLVGLSGLIVSAAMEADAAHAAGGVWPPP